MLIGREFKFDAAHYLPNYDGPCANMHGHTWTLTVILEGTLNDYGFVMDFNTLKDVVNPFVRALDHSIINENFNNPTCEKLSAYLAEQIALRIVEPNIDRVVVKLQEGTGGWSMSTYERKKKNAKVESTKTRSAGKKRKGNP